MVNIKDFENGAVCGIIYPAARRDASVLAPVKRWIAEGKLVFEPGGNSILQDRLWPAGTMPKQAESKPVSKQRLPELRGNVAWMVSAQEFVDGLLLPVGCRVTAFDEHQPHKFSSGDIHAARDCERRVAKDTGAKPMLIAISGHLRVLQRAFLTDTKPGVETVANMANTPR
jgi:hypothetical protein